MTMKKLSMILALVLALALVMTGCGTKKDDTAADAPAVSEDAAATENTEGAAEGGTLVMATNAEFPPYEYHEGDEIVGIAHEDVRRIPQLATCLLDAIRELPICLGVTAPLHLSASIGYTTTVHGYQEAIDAADRAMYAAKRRGKDQVACID